MAEGNEDKHSKTEKPSPRKLKKAKDDGNVARSAELASWVFLLLSSFLVPMYLRLLMKVTSEQFSLVKQIRSLSIDELSGVTSGVFPDIALLALPPMLAAMLAGMAFSLAQTGFVFSFKPLQPKMEKISPLKGAKRVASKKTLWESFKQVLRLVVITAICVPVIRSAVDVMVSAPPDGFEAGAAFVGQRILLMLRLVAATGFGISLLDFAFQRKNRLDQLKMTKQELKRESKDLEGDPEIRVRRRYMQSELSRNRVLSSVADSTVVVVNPTHFAVALLYDMEVGVPVITDLGSGDRALLIRDEALSASVPVVESVPLARALFKRGKRGSAVDSELYAAVAILLAFVAGLKKKTSIPIIHRLGVSGAELEISDSGELLSQGT